VIQLGTMPPVYGPDLTGSDETIVPGRTFNVVRMRPGVAGAPCTITVDHDGTEIQYFTLWVVIYAQDHDIEVRNPTNTWVMTVPAGTNMAVGGYWPNATGGAGQWAANFNSLVAPYTPGWTCNPRNYPGFHGNATRITDAATTLGSNVVTSPGGGFAGAVVGQTIWISRKVPETTITAVVDATEVHVDDVAVSNGTACECVYGGDDTAAFQAAFDAATLIPGIKGTVEVPNTRTMLTDRFFYYPTGSYAPNLIGQDSGSCLMYVSPDLPIPVDGSGALIHSHGGSNILKDCGVWCPYSQYVMLGDQALVTFDGTVIVDNFAIQNPFITNSGGGVSGALRTFNGQLTARFTQIGVVYDAAVGSYTGLPAGNVVGWIQKICGGTMTDPFFSNLVQALDVSSLVTRQGAGGGPGMLVSGGFFDECGAGGVACVEVHDEGTIQFDGTQIWTQALSGQYVMHVDGTSRAWLQQTGLSPFAVNTSGARALKIDAGGVVYAGQSTFACTKDDSDVSVQNDGTFVDCGGNDFINLYPGPDPVAASPRAAVANLDDRFVNSFAGLQWRSSEVLPRDA